MALEDIRFSSRSGEPEAVDANTKGGPHRLFCATAGPRAADDVFGRSLQREGHGHLLSGYP